MTDAGTGPSSDTSRDTSSGPARIWLIGLMGAGKSTVGRLVAGGLGVTYADNDATVAHLAGVSTVSLSHAGQGVLHAWEDRYVREIVARPGAVVAGIAASSADRPADLRLLAGSGLLVYLACDIATLVARVTADPDRPWLGRSAAEVTATLQGMHDQRDAVLRAAAQLTLDATQPPGALAGAVLSAVHSSMRARSLG